MGVARILRAECLGHLFFSISPRPRCIAAVCWFLLRGWASIVFLQTSCAKHSLVEAPFFGCEICQLQATSLRFVIEGQMSRRKWPSNPRTRGAETIFRTSWQCKASMFVCGFCRPVQRRTYG